MYIHAIHIGIALILPKILITVTTNIKNNTLPHKDCTHLPVKGVNKVILVFLLHSEGGGETVVEITRLLRLLDMDHNRVCDGLALGVHGFQQEGVPTNLIL